MEGMVLVVVVVVVLAVIVLFARLRPAAGLPYKLDRALFTPAERSFLGVLDQAVAGRYRVFGKIRLADVVRVAGTCDKRDRQRAFNRISSKHFDFVLCDPSDLSVVCAIELDDRSHRKAARGKRDRFLVELCEQVGLPLVRFPARRGYSASELESRIDAAIGITPTDAESESAAEDEAPAPSASEGQEPERSSEHVESDTPPSCPTCGASMALKTARRGTHAGRQFWACSLFPKCRTAIPVDSPAEEA